MRRDDGRGPGRAQRRFVLRTCVLGWGLPMFAWFFLATELALPLLAGRPLSSPLSMLFAVALQLPFWVAGGFWFGRLLWRWLPAERRAALEARPRDDRSAASGSLHGRR